MDAREQQRSVTVAWIDLAGKMFWPAIVLVVLMIFRNNLSGALEAAKSQIMNAASIDVKGVVITLPSKNTNTIPQLKDEHRAILSELDRDLKRFILEHPGSGGGISFCYTSGYEEVNRLAKMKLVQFRAGDPHDRAEYETRWGACDPPATLIHIDWTPAYGEIRNFYLEILYNTGLRS